MHVVIPVRVSRQNKSLEMALTSIREHTDCTPVLVGHNPGLDELHIPTVQGRDKFANTALAMQTACDTDWITDPFIWSNDDIHWTRPTTPTMWAIGDLRDDTRTNVYGKRKAETAQTLTDLGLPTWDYEAHVPMLVHKAGMLEALTLDGTFRSLYGNLTGPPDHISPDVKLRSHRDPLPDSPYISTNTTTLRLLPMGGIPQGAR